MLKKTVIPMKAKLGLTKKRPTLVLERANAVLAGLYSDPDDYGKPPVEPAVFKSSVDLLGTKITAALDGGKQAVAERDRQTAVVIKLMHQLAHYAEVACKDDKATFLKSGFETVSATKIKREPLSQFIRNLAPGANPGQLLVTLVAVAGAASYEIRWAPVGQGGALGQFTSQLAAKARPAISISGLTPGTTYSIQVRSLINAVWSEWSDPVTRISM